MSKMQSYEQMTLSEFLVRQSSRGPYAYSENDPAIWATFFQNSDRFPELAAIENTKVDVFLERYAFYLNPLDAERDGLNWVLSTSIIDYPIAATFDQFKADLPLLREQIGLADLQKPVITDSFMFADGFTEASGLMENGLIALNSPVAKIKPTFEEYLESLTSERRKKFRRSDEELSGFGLRFDWSNRVLSEHEMEFVVLNLKKKWGDEFLYALCQTLWSEAVARHLPQTVFYMRVYDGDKLVFLQSLIARNKTMICQSIVKDEEVHFNGIAAYTDFQCIKALTGSSFIFFDPSCRTGLSDPESIGVAKRATVNYTTVKPIFCAGKNLPDPVKSVLDMSVIQGRPL